MNSRARVGDLLLLTKPLGTGIATTGIKRGLTSAALTKKSITLMCQLNIVGSELAELGLIRAAVDVTGFGLLGHLGSMCHASGVGAEIVSDIVPVDQSGSVALIANDCVPGGTKQNLENRQMPLWTRWKHRRESRRKRPSRTDAQTSGGLLLCVPPKRLVPEATKVF